jgi:Hydrazine synthase alpha subunit middle domain/WD40-like Beta Propeller Repeat
MQASFRAVVAALFPFFLLGTIVFADSSWTFSHDSASFKPINDKQIKIKRNLVAQKSSGAAADGPQSFQTKVINTGNDPYRLTEVPIGTIRFPKSDLVSERIRPLSHNDSIWYDSTFWAGPDWTRVGRNWHHSGQNTASIRRFNAPCGGTVSVTGRVFKLDTKPDKNNDGVAVFIFQNEQLVWNSQIDGTDSKGVEHDLRLEVDSDDAIRFIVHRRSNISYDTTGWNPRIEYLDGDKTVYQASDGFAKTKETAKRWSYEMVDNNLIEKEMPVVYQLKNDLSIRSFKAIEGKQVLQDRPESVELLFIELGGQGGTLLKFSDPSKWWQLDAVFKNNAQLSLKMVAIDKKSGLTVGANESVELPKISIQSYKGSWLDGLRKLEALKKDSPSFAKRLKTRFDNLAKTIPAWQPPSLDLWSLLQQQWQKEDSLSPADDSYNKAIAKHLENGSKLLTELREKNGPNFLAVEKTLWDQLSRQSAGKEISPENRKRLYEKIRLLKRHIAFSNPLFDVGPLLFTKRVPSSYSHLVMQYYGWRARPGGGIFVLKRPGYSLECHDITGGKLKDGNVLEPRLSYDAKKIIFSYVECKDGALGPEDVKVDDPDHRFYHLYEINVDGTGLRQITSGAFDDLMPTWLPDGGIAFCSTRRKGYARCFGSGFSWRWHVYTLHRVEADGSDLRTLSVHDTNEWFPTVSNTGHVLYSRWDYIDRDAVTHQNLWSNRPDGTNPMAVWGNATLKPHCTFQLQPIPESNKLVFTASAHHSIAGGSIALVDPSVADNGQEAITRITPEVIFPEAEGRNIPEYYSSPWPLSEDFFLVSYSQTPLIWEPNPNDRAALGLYLLDAFGNRELIYRDPTIGSENACPIRPRKTPPVLIDNRKPDGKNRGEMILADIYRGLGPDCKPGSIKKLRIVQILPKSTPFANTPAVGLAFEENARAILGTVPVEEDGSARFYAPAGKPLLFQAIDEDGFAYQTMRTITYLQPGETISCVGCHESRMTSPTRPPHHLAAMRRRPSKIDPGTLGGRAWSFVEVVQPILDRHCVCCHGGEKTEGKIDLTSAPYGSPVPGTNFTKSYIDLCGDNIFWGDKGNDPSLSANALVPRFGGRNQIEITEPGGRYGARGSRLIRMIREGHEGVELSREELRRIGTWIDLNATFYGTNLPEDQKRQLNGEILPIPSLQ